MGGQAPRHVFKGDANPGVLRMLTRARLAQNDRVPHACRDTLAHGHGAQYHNEGQAHLRLRDGDQQRDRPDRWRR
ncbi:MAG: hypothetical protein R6U98_28625 [Pirellulaceae bacterium]